MGRHLGCVGTLLVLTLRGAVGGGEFGAAAPAADAIMSGMFSEKESNLYRRLHYDLRKALICPNSYLICRIKPCQPDQYPRLHLGGKYKPLSDCLWNIDTSLTHNRPSKTRRQRRR